MSLMFSMALAIWSVGASSPSRGRLAELAQRPLGQSIVPTIRSTGVLPSTGERWVNLPSI